MGDAAVRCRRSRLGVDATTWSCFPAQPIGIRTSSRIPITLMSAEGRALTASRRSVFMRKADSTSWRADQQLVDSIVLRSIRGGGDVRDHHLYGVLVTAHNSI